MMSSRGDLFEDNLVPLAASLLFEKFLGCTSLRLWRVEVSSILVSILLECSFPFEQVLLELVPLSS
jgi:hypothetical protein